MKSFWKYAAIYIGSLVAITVIWRVYEDIIYGQTYPDAFDSIIAVAFCYILTLTVMYNDELDELQRKYYRLLNMLKGDDE